MGRSNYPFCRKVLFATYLHIKFKNVGQDVKQISEWFLYVEFDGIDAFYIITKLNYLVKGNRLPVFKQSVKLTNNDSFFYFVLWGSCIKLVCYEFRNKTAWKRLQLVPMWVMIVKQFFINIDVPQYNVEGLLFSELMYR